MGFNPPPGWPVPRGWEPPPDWSPDPTWPAAPEGWQFWAPDAAMRSDAAAAPQQQRRPARNWLPVALVAVAVLVVTAVAGGGYLVFDRLTADEPVGGPVAGQLRGTFPDKPVPGWRLDSAEVFDRAEFVRPDATSYQYLRPGFIAVDDAIVTAAVLPQSDRGATLLAIDIASGTIRWTADVGFKPVCASATIAGLLPCVGKEAVFGAQGSGPPPYLSFIRMADGVIDHRIAVDAGVRAVEVHDGAVYTMGYDSDGEARTLSRGSTDDLTSEWTRNYPVLDNEGCPGSGDTLIDGVDGDLVFSGNDSGVVVARTSDGQRLVPDAVSDLVQFGDRGFTARTCDPDEPDLIRTAIVDHDGKTLRTVRGPEYVADPWLVPADADVPYIIGTTAYNFGSGDEIWTAEGAGRFDLHTIIGDTVIGGGYGSDQEQLVGFDLATGERLWTSDTSGDRIALSDGRHIMVVNAAGMVAVDLATGEELWTLNGIQSSAQTGAAGDGFADSTSESITYFAPTGPPAVAPGRADDDAGSRDAEGSGGVITKCGRTPEMTPVHYRAEGGSLIATMELRARCSEGDIVSTDTLRVTVRDDSGLICDGVFDFSADPLILGGENASPTTVEMEFGAGNFSRLPNTLGDRSARPADSGEIVTDTAAAGNEMVECIDEGSSNGPDSADTPTERTRTSAQRSQNGEPQTGCGSEADALAALRAQVDTDRPFVQRQLADRWVAQLSSKQPGLVAPDVDGRVVTWTPCEILQQHLRIRGQYPEVRLAWSSEWQTFDLRDWWVTFAGVTFPDPEAANSWCDMRAIPVDECFAKVISNTRDSRGSTRYRG
ncbi:MAG: PQQ-binding-like beta-propeller repeat protein [Microbacteriaceae bacterium]